MLTEMVQIYEAWETDKIISVELWRNLSLCLFAVAGVSLMLLGDFRYTRSDPDLVITFKRSLCSMLQILLSSFSKPQVDGDGRCLHPRDSCRPGQRLLDFCLLAFQTSLLVSFL